MVSIDARFGLLALATAATALGACRAPDDGASEELGATVEQPIVNGKSAASYVEAALIDTDTFICSGAVIAPRVVLTAGHCVVGASSWTVTTPFAQGKKAHGSQAWTTYTSTGEYVNPSAIDVAVIVLDTPIDLAFYPPLAQAKVAAGTSAINVGRIEDEQPSWSSLFAGTPVALQDGASYGFPNDYAASEIIESGDSGGPVYVGSGASRTIVAVNSGAGGGSEVLARVDLVYAKIQQVIAQASGGGNSGPSGTAGGTSGTTPSPSSPDPATPAAPSCGGVAEVEPNDDSNAANALSGAACGTLASGGDVDWYTWKVGGAGVAYDVSLAADGDAQIAMWKWTGSAWSPIQNGSPTDIAATSSSAGTYVIGVASPTGATQSYTLTLSK